MPELENNKEKGEDVALIERYKKSSNQADLAPFFQKYMGLIYGVSLKYLKDPVKSKDVVMDIYEKLVSKLLKHDVSNPKAWLYTMTKNHCYEILRSTQRMMEKKNEAVLMYSEEIFHPYNSDEKEGELIMLEDCVEGLESEQQQAVRMFYLDKKTYQEVTEGMKVSWNRARSLIQNGRRNLKKCMEKKYESVREK